MDHALPGSREASYRLLGLQALVHDGGVILKRGTTRVFLQGEDVAELVDLLVERLAGGRAVPLRRVLAEVGADRRDALLQLVETLKAHRFLTSADRGEGRGRNREDVFFWNYRTSFDEIVGELAAIHMTVFGVNTIGLALLGNLRGCGFRKITFVDHPALRNVDYYDSRQRLRHEISGALSVPPAAFDDWSATNANPDGCLVVCCDFGGRPLMRDWNRFAVEKNVMFYPVVLLDHVAHLGPLVRPGEGPCYECLWARQDANMADAALVRAGEVEPDSGHQAIGYLQPMARAAADFAAVDLLKSFSRSLSANPLGRIIEVDLLEPGLTSRDLVKVPGCPVCAAARSGTAVAKPQEEATPETAETETEPAAATESAQPETEAGPGDPETAAEPAEPSGAEPTPETAAEGAT
jgi:bacteriocin biosynthesis cyclodehydratase domain-containing protein